MIGNYENIFSVFETDGSVNSDIIVNLTPPPNILKYEYTLIKDGVKSDYHVVQFNNPSVVNINESGLYVIEVNLYDNYLNKLVIYSGNYIVDKEKPIINVNEKSIEIKAGDKFDALSYVNAYDELDGDLTKEIISNYDQLNLSTKGVKELIYSVSDKAGNTATNSIYVNVIHKISYQLIFFDITILLSLFIFFILLFRYVKSVKLEKRIAKYSIEPIHDNSLSVFDKLFKKYSRIVDKLGESFEKSVFLTKYSKKYEKYIGTVDGNHKKAIDFVVTKTFIGFLFLVIAIVSKTVRSEVLSLHEIVIPIIVGFFIPDIIYFSKYKVYRAKVENDLLQAIIIMNNAFKSGRSITQAIDLVANELEGPIAEEFKKMSLEISFGLAIEDVFRRFSQRIQLKEVTYLTASLSILNKTGGNIIKVFSSIEKTLFSQKKLKLELISLTGSSKIIVYILFIVPILFVAFISIIDPTYFLPLITTPLGFIISLIVIIAYIFYIFIVKKIMKVRM